MSRTRRKGKKKRYNEAEEATREKLEEEEKAKKST
jgi:hypothetical protein